MMNEQLFSEQANDCAECSEWITKNGCIVAPGKFQGETLATPHAYHFAMEGFVDDTVTFGESATYDRVGNVVLYYSDQGFVYGTVCDDDETAELHMKTLHEQAEQEDEQESDN